MRIALTMRVTETAAYHEPRDAISHDWISWLTARGDIPVLIPNLIDGATGFLTAMAPDLLILTGGDDPGDNPVRDRTERALLDYAASRNMPVLGVCRGLQIINAHFGGTLRPVDGHVGTTHNVEIADPWRPVYGGQAAVNSYHRLGVAAAGLGKGLTATALDGDGMVEGLVHSAKSIAAVMWHPERDGAPAADSALLSKLCREGAFWR